MDGAESREQRAESRERERERERGFENVFVSSVHNTQALAFVKGFNRSG